jgi:hypothetical protein
LVINNKDLNLKNPITENSNEIGLQMYKIFVDCKRFHSNPSFNLIKKSFFLLATLLFFACAENTQIGNCLPNINIEVSTDLNNPININAQTPGGFTILNGGNKGILLFNINNSSFVAFDLLCPNNDCSTPMTFENGLTLKCVCDESEYSVHLGGAPQTNGSNCPAREYRVLKNGTSIRITNF